MTIDQIIALAASIGACLSALATFLTVRQVARQREASYKPEITPSRTHFRSTTNPLTKGPLPDLWVEPLEGADPVPARPGTHFSVPLRNIGLGAAKAVEASWSFQIGAFVEAVNRVAQRSLTPAYFSYESGMLHFNTDNSGRSTSIWQNQQRASIDYLMSAAVESKPVMLVVPHAYITLVSALLFFNARDKDSKRMPDIPPLTLQLVYRDIGDRKHSGAFEVHCELAAVRGDGEVLHGWLEFTKTA